LCLLLLGGDGPGLGLVHSSYLVCALASGPLVLLCRCVGLPDEELRADLEGHTHDVSRVLPPGAPVIITGSEDGTLRIWHRPRTGWRNTLNYGLERVWAIAYMKGSNRYGWPAVLCTVPYSAVGYCSTVKQRYLGSAALAELKHN